MLEAGWGEGGGEMGGPVGLIAKSTPAVFRLAALNPHPPHPLPPQSLACTPQRKGIFKLK